MHADHLINFELIKHARQATKEAFIPAGDGGMGGGMGGDPAAAGMGMPPGGDPAAAGGGAPPPDAGGGGTDPLAQQVQMLQQQMQQMQMGGGAGGAGAGGPLKPKIDVNVALMQISKMLARIADALGVQIPAHEMIATPQDLTAMATQQQTGAPGTPLQGGSGSGGDAGAGAGAIQPMGPMQGMQPAGVPGAQPGAQKMGSYRSNGRAFDPRNIAAPSSSGFAAVHDKAAALARIRRAERVPA